MRARIRGIYATALTRVLLDAGHDVVQASDPIRERFDAEFEAMDGDHEASVETTADRQGVGVEGVPAAVARAVALAADVGRDAFPWADPAPRGAVFDAAVTETHGGGAVCDLGLDAGAVAPEGAVALAEANGEGYLPFDAVNGYVEVGDVLRVQVVASAPPWVDDRPTLDATIRAFGGLATLVSGREGVTVEGTDDAAGRELAGMTDLLGADVPDGWGVRWTREARGASMDALGDALSRAAERAAELEDALDEPVDDPGRLVAPTATAWVWFGRESRFALDARRRAVAPTMPGHHRTKAASTAASAGVDLAEAICADALGGWTGEGAPSENGDAGDFPFGVVADQFGPREGDTVRIGHGKPDGRLLVLGSGEVVQRDRAGNVAVQREIRGRGRYDALGTPREGGDTALTKFREGRRWYPTVYRGTDGEHKGTYVNVCTPVECFPNVVRYVDLHVDVIKHPDGRVERVDDDELDAAVEAGYVSEELADQARGVASSIENAL